MSNAKPICLRLFMHLSRRGEWPEWTAGMKSAAIMLPQTIASKTRARPSIGIRALLAGFGGKGVGALGSSISHH
jgi:hypothetical protein